MRCTRSRTSGGGSAPNRTTRQRTKHARRGYAALAALLIMLFLWLSVTGAIVTGTRDQDQWTNRINTTKAFYAAEGGTNMAIREIMTGVDEDGDSTVGSISDDGVPGNDPAIGPARVYVHLDEAIPELSISAHGRCAISRRKVVTDLEMVPQ